jgi:hypothetical protein
MSLGLWPEAVPFDPNSGTASHDLQEHFEADGMPSAVLLVCSRELRGGEWPARAAIGLARALVPGAREVVLADLDFERPTLHELLGVANSEGVADALLFGASLERVTVQPAGEMFGFVPPGAVAPDPADLMANPAWARLAAEQAADRLLLAFAALGAPGLDALAERIPAVVVLAEESEVAATAAMLPETIRVAGVIRPAGTVAAEAAEDTGTAESGEVSGAEEPLTGPEPGDEAAREEAVAPATADASEPEPAEPAEAEQPAAEDAVAGQPDRPAPRPLRPARPVAPARPPWRRVLPWVAFLVVAGGAGWFGGRLLAGSGESTAAQEDAAAFDGVEPAGQLLGYSVVVEAYDNLNAAAERTNALSAAAPDLLFFVAPVEIDASPFYRVMAGPVADSATARATMLRLVQQGLKIAASEFDVRATPLAFLVGRYEFRGDAEERMTELETRAVPTYMIEVPYTQGPVRFHVYAGAYSGPTEAALMRARLQAAGIQDTLVLRIGRSAP